jgi:hypothetical protein
LVNGVKHVQQVYLTLVDEVRGMLLYVFSGLLNNSATGFMVSFHGR